VPKPPVIVQSVPADGANFEADTGQDVILSCQVDAFPAADILWINNKVCSLKSYNLIGPREGIFKTSKIFIKL